MLTSRHVLASTPEVSSQGSSVWRNGSTMLGVMMSSLPMRSSWQEPQGKCKIFLSTCVIIYHPAEGFHYEDLYLYDWNPSIDGLVQDCSISSASCTKPSICTSYRSSLTHPQVIVDAIITMTSHGYYGISSQRQIAWLLNILFRLVTKKSPKLRIVARLWRYPPVTSGFL